MNLPPLPEPLIRLPMAQAVQWNTAIGCAEREPLKDVVLEGRTVLAVENAIREYAESCARMAREDAAKLCEKLAEEGYGDWKHATPTDCAAAIRKG